MAHIERKLYGHPLAGLFWERQFEEVPFGLGREKSTDLGMFFCSSQTTIVLVGIRRGHQNHLKEADYCSHVKEIDEFCRSWRINFHFLTTCISDALNVNASRTKLVLTNKSKLFESRETPRRNCRIVTRYERSSEKVR